MYYLATAERLHTRNATAALHDHGLTHQEWRLLAIIHEYDGRGVGQLSDLAGLDRSNASKLVASLEKRGLVRRGSHQRDRRQSPLSLTRKGQGKFQETQDIIRRLFHDYMRDFSDAEFETLMLLLGRLKESVARQQI